ILDGSRIRLLEEFDQRRDRPGLPALELRERPPTVPVDDRRGRVVQVGGLTKLPRLADEPPQLGLFSRRHDSVRAAWASTHFESSWTGMRTRRPTRTTRS